MTVVSLLLDFIYRRPEFSLDGVSTKDVRDLRDLATTYDMKDLVYATNQKECPTRLAALTDEVVLMILQYLPVPDLVNLRGVSTKLAGLTEDKKFWKRTFIVDMHLFRANEDLITRDLVNIRGRSFPDSTYVCRLSDLDLGDLAHVVCQVEGADFCPHTTGLDDGQMSKILSTISEESRKTDIRLQLLNLDWLSLPGVAPDLLADAFENLTHLSLVRTRLSAAQLTAIVGRAESKMQKLDVGQNNLEEVDERVWTTLMAKLQALYMYSTNLTTSQYTSLLTTLAYSSDGDLTIDELDIGCSDLREVDHKILGKAIMKLKSMGLLMSKLHSSQVQSVFNVIKREDQCRLQELIMDAHHMFDLDESLVVEVKNKVNLSV